MKHIVFCALVLLAGCSKVAEDRELYRVSVDIPQMRTKASGISTDGERGISSLQIAAYNSEGMMEEYVSTETGNATLSLRRGVFDIYAVVNAPSLASAGTKSSLLSSVSRLSDNAVGRLVMFGGTDCDVSGDGDVTIDVARVVSKIVVDKVTNGFADSWLSGKALTLNAIYLTNVNGSAKYDGTMEGSIWHDRMGFDPSEQQEIKALIYDQVGQSIPQGGSHSTVHSFYCYANGTDANPRGGSWSPRHTRLVLDASVSGVSDHCYYVLDLPAIQHNRVYEFTDIKLVNLGSEDEETLADANALCFSVSVSEWIGEIEDLEMNPTDQP